MNEGIYLRCDPYGGWSVVVVDSAGGFVRELISPVPTMEEAMRRFATAAGNSILMKLTDPQLPAPPSGLMKPLRVLKTS